MRTTVAHALLLITASSLFAGVTSEKAILSIQQRIAARDLDGAEKELAAALRSDPENGGLFNLRGIVSAERGEYEAAAEDFSKAIELSPGLSGAYLNLARIYLLRIPSDPSAAASAMNLYRRLLRRDPRNVEARSQLILLLEKQDDFAEALSELSLLPRSEQAKAPVQAMRCLALAGAGRKEEAQSAASDLLASRDLSERDVLEISRGLFREKRADLVRDLVVGLVKRNLASLESLEQLIQACDELHPSGGARAVLERLAQDRPQSPALLIALARVAYREHDLEGALGYLAHARDLSPQDPAIHFFFGIVAIDLDLVTEAKKSLDRAVALDPGNVYYQYALGGVDLQMGAADDAVARFRIYTKSHPGDPRGHFALGAAEFAAGNVKESQAEMERAARSKQTAAGAEYYLGRMARLNGKPEEAEEHLKRSIQADPGFAESQAELGRLRMEQGDPKAARDCLDRALRIDPDNYQANLFLLALYQRTKDPQWESQRKRVAELQKKRSRKQTLMLRTIHLEPYEAETKP